MYSSYCKAQQRLNEISVFFTTATRTATEITQTGYSTKNIFKLINRSLRPTGPMPQIILRLLGFLCVREAGRRGNKITARLRPKWTQANER